MCFTDKDTLGVFLLMFGGAIGGMTRTMYPSIPIYGVILNFLGLCLLMLDIKKYNVKTAYMYMFPALLLFAFSYVIGPRLPYSNDKIISIVINSVLWIIAYRCIISSESFSYIRFAQLLLMVSVLALVFIMNNYGFAGPTSFFDYSWFRNECVAYDHMDDSKIMVGYQQIGMDALYAIAFLLAKKRPKAVETLIYFLIGFQVIMTSGARQAIVGIAIVVFFKVLFLSNLKRAAKVWLFSALLIGLFSYAAILIRSDMDWISGMFNVQSGADVMEASGRANAILGAQACISSHPILGAGLGGFELYGSNDGFNDDSYPHNIILEILCETGVVGLVILIAICWLFIKRNKVTIRFETQNGLYFALFIIAMLCRFFFSSDLTNSIGVFCGLFCMYSFPLKNNRIVKL